MLAQSLCVQALYKFFTCTISLNTYNNPKRNYKEQNNDIINLLYDLGLQK